MAYEIRTLDSFTEWLDGLRDAQARQAIAKGLVKLAGGLFGNVEPVGDGVSELKVHVGAGYRAYFVTRQRTVIVMLCGGDKSSQERDIREAKRIAALLD